MRIHRSVLLTVSGALVAVLLGGGFAVRARASEDSFRQAVLFSEVLSLVLDNYVDPVEAERLLRGAYEGMLGGLDPNGAFLSPEEVKAWKSDRDKRPANPGLTVLKLGRSLQVVGVAPESSAAEAGIQVGDQIRTIGGEPVRDLSLAQARRALGGSPGEEVELEVLQVDDEFRAKKVTVVRQRRQPEPYQIRLQRGVAVLRIRDLEGIDFGAVSEELDDVRSRGASRLLIDLRNSADSDPRAAAAMVGWLSGGTLRLRDTSGRLLETLESEGPRLRWDGEVALLVNWATAGGSEAVALLARERGEIRIFGQSTYGLGAEAKLYELETGSGLLISSAMWETAGGASWNADGVEPDEEVEGRGDSYAEVESDQLFKVLDLLEAGETGAADVDEAA